MNEKIFFPLYLIDGDQILDTKTQKVLYECHTKKFNFSFLGLFKVKTHKGLAIKTQEGLDRLIKAYRKETHDNH